MTRIGSPMLEIPGARVANELSSHVARLADVQALVSSILAELAALEPPQRPGHPAAGTPDHMLRAFQERMAAFQRALSAFNRKLAHLNSRLQLAFRAMAELEHQLDRLESMARHMSEREMATRAEALQRQLRSQRDALEAAARAAADRQRHTDRRPGTPELMLVGTSVGGHLDGDGRVDLRCESFMLVPRVPGDVHESLREQLTVLTQTVPSLQVLPPGDALDAEAVVELDRFFEPELGEEHIDLLRSMLLNEALPDQRAEADVWARTAGAMRMPERRLVELVLGSPEPTELAAYAADYTTFVASHTGRAPSDRQSEEFAWRLAAGHRIGDPAFFLQTTEITPPRDERDEVRFIREWLEVTARSWDGALRREETLELLAAVRASSGVRDTSGPDLDVFPIDGGLYNIGYDANWNVFDQDNAYHSSDFGPGDAKHQASGRGHPANDIFAPRGAPLVAPFDGVVVGIGSSDVGGNWIQIERGNTRVYYAHMDEHRGELKVGDTLAAGQQVGTVGNTGSARGTAPHLHISLTVAGTKVDPFPYLMAARERVAFSRAEAA